MQKFVNCRQNTKRCNCISNDPLFSIKLPFITLWNNIINSTTNVYLKMLNGGWLKCKCAYRIFIWQCLNTVCYLLVCIFFFYCHKKCNIVCTINNFLQQNYLSHLKIQFNSIAGIAVQSQHDLSCSIDQQGQIRLWNIDLHLKYITPDKHDRYAM